MNSNLNIEVTTNGFEEATEKANELAEAIEDISDKFIIRNSRDCVFNFYVNKNRKELK